MCKYYGRWQLAAGAKDVAAVLPHGGRAAAIDIYSIVGPEGFIDMSGVDNGGRGYRAQVNIIGFLDEGAAVGLDGALFVGQTVFGDDVVSALDQEGIAGDTGLNTRVAAPLERTGDEAGVTRTVNYQKRQHAVDIVVRVEVIFTAGVKKERVEGVFLALTLGIVCRAEISPIYGCKAAVAGGVFV